MEYYAYILKSIKDKRYYYGSTSNIEVRIKKHNAGGVPSTKYRRPLELKYIHKYPSKKEAQDRERYFKTIDGYNWLKQNKVI